MAPPNKQVVSIAVVNKDGKLLIGLRGDSGKWNCPGGHMEDGETPAQAAKRELKEETGLDADISSTDRIGFWDKPDGSIRVHSFIAYIDGTPDASADPDEEMVSFKWIGIKTPPKAIMGNLHNKRDVTLQFLGMQDRDLDIIWDEDGMGDTDGAREIRALSKSAAPFKPLDKVVLDPSAGYKLTHHDPEVDGIDEDQYGAVGVDTPYYDEMNGTKLHEIRAHDAAGNRVGSAAFQQIGKKLKPLGVFVQAAHRRRGLASAMYAHAEQATGAKVVPSDIQTSHGRNLWRGNAALPQFGAKKVRKSEFHSELDSWLAKTTNPDDFKAIARATTHEGARLVDHLSQINSHPPQHNPVVEHYHHEVLTGPKLYRKKTQGGGITRKLVYQTKSSQQGDLLRPNHFGMDAKFMVKPYHEKIPARIDRWQRYHVQGWAEMANQSLYHAGGIGHLHQKVHVAEHNMGPGKEREPALVVQMDHGFKPMYEPMRTVYQQVGDNPKGLAYEAYIDPTDNARADARRVGLMDFLTNNLDRHSGNLMISEDGNRILAIDHSRSFQYVNNHQYKWDPKTQVKRVRELTDKFSPYIAPSESAVGALDNYNGIRNKTEAGYHRLENYRPAFEWWGQVGQNVRKAFYEEISKIKDPAVRDHMKRNFDARAHWLDERANLGIENFGIDWHHDPVVQYHPDQKSDEELDEERNQKLREEWEREEAERKAKEQGAA